MELSHLIIMMDDAPLRRKKIIPLALTYMILFTLIGCGCLICIMTEWQYAFACKIAKLYDSNQDGLQDFPTPVMAGRHRSRNRDGGG